MPLPPTLSREPLLLLALLLAAVCVVLLIRDRRRPHVTERVLRHRMEVATPQAAIPLGPSAADKARGVGSTVTLTLSRLFGAEEQSTARRMLDLAGSPTTLERYERTRLIFSFVLAPLISLLVLFALGLKPLGIIAAILVLLALPRVPAIQLKQKAAKRAKLMDRQLPDALDLLVVSVEGGLSLPAAIAQVANRGDTVVAKEFQRLLEDLRSGMQRRDAFIALGNRSQSESLAIICSTIVQADKVGMSVAATLRSLSETMRKRRRQAAEARARQAPIKMMPVLVLFMVPSLFIIAVGPAVIQIIQLFSTAENAGP